MIIGLTGAICSGKNDFAIYLVNKYGFIDIDLLARFMELIGKDCKESGSKNPEQTSSKPDERCER